MCGIFLYDEVLLHCAQVLGHYGCSSFHKPAISACPHGKTFSRCYFAFGLVTPMWKGNQVIRIGIRLSRLSQQTLFLMVGFLILACPSTLTADTIWNPSSIRAQIDSRDRNAVELGVRFQADVAGVISGIRFYKARTNTGTHIASLWSNTGTLLAQATFTAESASGWQQVTFSTPVAISANTVYVASYQQGQVILPADHGANLPQGCI